MIGMNLLLIGLGLVEWNLALQIVAKEGYGSNVASLWDVE